MPLDPKAAASFIADAHRQRAVFQNLPPQIAPATVDEAYAAQEALRELWTPLYGELAGLKIATTTKVMQALMGIDHPCGGTIFASRVHGSPARIAQDSDDGPRSPRMPGCGTQVVVCSQTAANTS